MTCKNCPEGESVIVPPLSGQPPVNTPTPSIYIVYTGGPFVNLYRMVELAIPRDAELKCGRPTFQNDGSLEYPPGDTNPVDIEGYARDQRNPRCFHPMWPDCLYRPLGVSVQDGLLVIQARCNHPNGACFGRPTTLAGCKTCAAREAPRESRPKISTPPPT